MTIGSLVYMFTGVMGQKSTNITFVTCDITPIQEIYLQDL